MQLEKKEIEILIEDKIKAAEKKFGKGFKPVLIEILGLEKLIAPEAQSNEKKSRLIPLADWNEYHPFPTVGALRQYRHYRDINGFDEVLEYGGENGGRVLIDEEKFFEWQRNRKKNAS